MIACIVIPGFELRAALRKRPGLALEPAALGPPAGAEPLIGSVTAAAEAAGVRPGMRMGEALATCPSLVLVEPDPAAAEQAWEEVLRRLEDAGFAVDPAEPGCVYFETRGVERLYGGLGRALERALAAVGSTWDPRAGAAERRFTALAAANVARPGQALVVSDEVARDFLAPLSLDLLPLAEQEQQELRELGIRRLGELARLPAPAVAERLGPEGRQAWQLARGGRRARVRGRRPPAEIVESLEFPEAVGNELTLRRALATLVDRVLARPERRDRFVRKVALAARLVGGASWRRTLTLREPSAERDRIRIALGPKLAEVPAPVAELRLELVELSSEAGRQLALVEPSGAEARARLQEGLRQVRASTGGGSVCTVVEVAPWSRIPEARALFVPRDE
ncbi:MAG TPA: DNA polymerase Y family protein [Gaiellaceae bacterium]|jgi:protein ImuB|nr:DNA polymerase Y family protein [Gaiellaceae bacterium]